MPDASRAKVNMEQGQSFTAMKALTDSGDATTFTSGGALLSRFTGRDPIVLPNGLVTGGAVTPAGSNDTVSAAAATVNLNGVVTSVTADAALSITRAVSTDTHMINSITVNAAGSYAVVTGTDGTSFSETRGDPGGPPLIPVDSIEIAQVRTTSFTSAVLLASEIFAVPNVHLEKADFPGYTINYETGKVVFASALPTIHTGTVPKAVHMEYYEAILAEVPDSVDFVPPEEAHATNSEQVYNRTIGSTSTSLGQGSFSVRTSDNVNDSVITNKNEILWFQFFQDRNKTAYQLTQAKLGISRTHPAGSSITCDCTLSAESATVERSA